MKRLFLLLTAIVLVSCNETENVIYNGDQALVYFGKASSNLAIAIDATGQVDVPINVSTLSSSARTVTVSIENTSTADPANYSLPTTVTIPANSYFGTLTISGTDVSAETNPELLILRITSFSDSGAVIGSQLHEVSVFQFCPIPPGAFTGDYLIEELTPFVDGPTLDDGQVVTVSATSDTGRTFMTKNYPTYCSPLRAFNFQLVCNEVIVDANQASTCQCSAAGLFFGPATTPSTYDVNDDSVFELTFTNDVTGDCSTATQTTYRFTKQ